MTDPILLEVVTPERRIFSAHVSELQFPTATCGYYGILPGHTPLITTVGRGLLYFTQQGESHWLTVFGGFAEVGPEHVTVLAKVAETVDMIDLEAVKTQRLQAEKLLKEAQDSEASIQAQTLLDDSLIRLQALGHTTN